MIIQTTIVFFFWLDAFVCVCVGEGGGEGSWLDVWVWGLGGTGLGVRVRVISGSQFYYEESVSLGVRGKPKKTTP